METFNSVFESLVAAHVPLYVAIIIAAAARAVEITLRFKRKKNNDE
jgi:hypothetical protein